MSHPHFERKPQSELAYPLSRTRRRLLVVVMEIGAGDIAIDQPDYSNCPVHLGLWDSCMPADELCVLPKTFSANEGD